MRNKFTNKSDTLVFNSFCPLINDSKVGSQKIACNLIINLMPSIKSTGNRQIMVTISLLYFELKKITWNTNEIEIIVEKTDLISKMSKRLKIVNIKKQIKMSHLKSFDKLSFKVKQNQ